MSLRRYVAGLILGVALLGAVAVAQNDATPLGDVARQRSGKKAAKTFDDDNFQRSTPPPAPASDPTSADSAKPDGSAQDDAKHDKKAGAAPGDDVKALENQLADLKQRSDITTEQIARLQSAIDRGGEEDTRVNLAQAQATYKERLASINAEIPVVEKKLEAARAARKSGTGVAGAPSKTDDSRSIDSKPDDTALSK